jgi:hypothetical protein
MSASAQKENTVKNMINITLTDLRLYFLPSLQDSWTFGVFQTLPDKRYTSLM